MFRKWLIRMSDVYPARWYWPVTRIYGGPDGQQARVCYMTRVLLSPPTRWGQLYLHIFHRPDGDRDPHDHPFNFWTLPVNQGYVEEVYEHHAHNEGCWKTITVPRWRVSYRAARHTHRVVTTTSGQWPLITIVWRSPNKRRWGFWTHDPARDDYGRKRYWTPFQDYVYEGKNSNLPGVDVSCPGTAGRFTDARQPR